MSKAAVWIRKRKVQVQLLQYHGESHPERGQFVEWIPDPKHLSELAMWVHPDHSLDPETDELGPQVGWNVHIGGTRRGLHQLGAFLINLAAFEPLDQSFYVRLSGLAPVQGCLPVEVVAHRAIDAKGRGKPSRRRRPAAGGQPE